MSSSPGRMSSSPGRYLVSTDREAAATGQEPEVVIHEMAGATRRLRAKGWMINALTEAPIIDETRLNERVAEG
jgi:hypothetical protein